MLNRAIFLDKDGTLVENLPYNVDPGSIRLVDGAGAALRRWAEAGFLLVVVSNQSGVARGYFPESALEPVRLRLAALMQEAGVALSGFYYCPHHPDGRLDRYAIACDCRKPNPGLLLRAAAELCIDLRSSWMVGDILDDVEAGRRAGCRTVLVDSGGETEWRLTAERAPDWTVSGLDEASRLVLETGVLL
jgi:D-glycero-D-manno-heptose 1,7-bisphosphate phosphatase